jgi:endonuclease-8
MPEGDTIHRAADTLQRAIGGQVVTRFESVLAKLNRVDADAPLRGRTIERVEARGKHLLIWFSGDLVLRTHMRMNGSWHIYRPGEPWQRPHRDMRIVIETATMHAIAFSVPVAELITTRALQQSPVEHLGPDPLSERFSTTRRFSDWRLGPTSTSPRRCSIRQRSPASGMSTSPRSSSAHG